MESKDRKEQVSVYFQEVYKQKHPNEGRVPIYKIIKEDGTRITQFLKNDGTIEDVVTLGGDEQKTKKLQKILEPKPKKFLFGRDGRKKDYRRFSKNENPK